MTAQAHNSQHVENGLPDWIILGFSGHRNIADEQTLRNALEQIVSHPSLVGHHLATISSAACGSDTVFLEEANSRGFPRFIILPFDRDTFSKDFTPEQWDRVLPLIDSAADIEVLPSGAPRNEAFLDAGLLSVDRCDIFIVNWNGKPAAGKGGTGDTVSYARLVGKPLIIIDHATGQTTYENFDKLHSRPGVLSTNSAADSKPFELVQTEYKRLAGMAKLHGPKSRNTVLIIILIHLVASAIASGSLVYFGSTDHGPWSIAAAVIKVVALTYALFLVHRYHHTHTSWLQSRFGTELCRSYIAIWKMRRSAQIVPDTEGMNVDSLAKSLRILWYLDKDQASDLQQAQQNYSVDRVQDQRKYFVNQVARARPRLIWGRRLALVGTIGTIVAIILCWTVFLHHSDGEYYKFTKLLSLILPLMSAAILSYLVSLDMGRRTIRYQEMIDMLDKADPKVRVAQTWPGLLLVVADTERKLLRELTEWYAVARYSGESH